MDDFVRRLANGEIRFSLSEESMTIMTKKNGSNLREVIVLDLSEARELSDWLQNHPALED